MQNNTLITLEKKLVNLVNLTKQQKTKEKKYDEFQNQVHESKHEDNSLTISYALIQKMPVKIKNIMQENFSSLIELSITNCDLRTFENFPKLYNLRNLNVSKNSLRGSFEFLVKNRTIKYIDVSQNIINDVKKFEPLRCLKTVNIFAKQNPFINNIVSGIHERKNSVLEQLKCFGIKLLDKPFELKKEENKEVKLQKNQKNISKENVNKIQEILDSQTKQKKYSKVEEKILRKRQIIDRRRYQQMQKYGSSKNSIHKMFPEDFSSFLHLMKIMGDGKNNNRVLRIQNQRERDNTKLSNQSRDFLNFYQIIHPEQFHLRGFCQEAQLNQSTLRRVKRESNDSNEVEVDLIGNSQNVYQKKANEQDIEIEFEREDIMINKENDENNSQSFQAISLESEMIDNDQEQA